MQTQPLWMLLLLSQATRAFRATTSTNCLERSLFSAASRSSSPITRLAWRSSSLLRANNMSTTTATNGDAAAVEQHQTQEYPTEMTEAERYLFDLNGFVIIRNVLSPHEIAQANAAIDARRHLMVERSDAALRNAVPGSRMYGTGPGRQDLGRVLEWGATDSRVFQSILAHPRLVPLFHGILGMGYRMDHLPFVIAQNQGAEGFQLHGGTIDCTSGEYNPHLAYTCHHGTIRSALLGCNVMLTDHNAGDGGFCIVPGSHKSNFVGETNFEFTNTFYWGIFVLLESIKSHWYVLLFCSLLLMMAPPENAQGNGRR